MVGLSVILESHGDSGRHKSSKVINKASLKNPTNNSFLLQSPPPPSFRLHFCCLCKRPLLPGNDIYMYKGDRGFCSVECRCRQILMDDDEEEESKMKDSSYKTPSFSISESASSSLSPSSSMAAVSRNRRG